MSSLFSTGCVLCLVWPLAFAGVVWAIVVWALRQDDDVSRVVDNLISPAPEREPKPRTPHAH